MLEFDAKTFLIHRLVKAAALVFVDFEAGANNSITFVLEDKVRRYFFGAVWCVWRIIKILRPDHSN